MTPQYPCLVDTPNTQIHDPSVSLLGRYPQHTNTWPLSILAWSIPQTHKYMTAQYPCLVDTPNTQIHDRSVSLLGRYPQHTNTWPLSILAWSIPQTHKYMTAHVSTLTWFITVKVIVIINITEVLLPQA
jgi:hypothetical protein